MYRANNEELEEKRKHAKMNMILNNLEQKLGGDEELCQGVAKIIDMSAENSLLIARLSQIKTSIPEIKKRILELTLACDASCSKERNNIMLAIHDKMSTSEDKPKSPEYMIKIQRTIEYCIANYEIYKQSSYNAKYCENGQSLKSPQCMTEDEILMLL